MIISFDSLRLVEIIKHLWAGELLAIPTETVYGLAGDAANPLAVKKIFHLKQRPVDHPLILHLAHQDLIAEWAINIPDFAWELAKSFWPGALTLILPKSAKVLPEITGGQSTVGIRIPNHPIALAILKAFEGGLVAPSANPFMGLSPTMAEHVVEFFGENLWVVDGGSCAVGIESTIIDCTQKVPELLRLGMITPAEIKAKTGITVKLKQAASLKHAGQHPIHYAPLTPLRFFDTEMLCKYIMDSGDSQLGILSYSFSKQFPVKKHIILSKNILEYATNFYAALHELDHANCSEILVETPPQLPEWEPLHERLKKASKRYTD